MYFSSDDGTAYAFGENKLGQLGQGSQTDAVLSPVPVSHPVISSTLCGAKEGRTWDKLHQYSNNPAHTELSSVCQIC